MVLLPLPPAPQVDVWLWVRKKGRKVRRSLLGREETAGTHQDGSWWPLVL